jgi:hypothetical protein
MYIMPCGNASIESRGNDRKAITDMLAASIGRANGVITVATPFQ